MSQPAETPQSQPEKRPSPPSDDADWQDGFRAAIRAIREITGGTYDQEVEREAVAMRLEDRLVAEGGTVTLGCYPPRIRPNRLPVGNEGAERG